MINKEKSTSLTLRKRKPFKKILLLVARRRLRRRSRTSAISALRAHLDTNRLAVGLRMRIIYRCLRCHQRELTLETRLNLRRGLLSLRKRISLRQLILLTRPSSTTLLSAEWIAPVTKDELNHSRVFRRLRRTIWLLMQ